jgi:alkanesulfonate monooxygenase SsuD/methylene tetrahydromethanopterin reductase-like flavin-dependent oxidoreductase (luciferase family)
VTRTFGPGTFGDRSGDADGKPASHAQTIRNLASGGVFAEQAGVDSFGIGEHHTVLPGTGHWHCPPGGYECAPAGLTIAEMPQPREEDHGGAS